MNCNVCDAEVETTTAIYWECPKCATQGNEVKSQWFPVSEGLPKESNTYWATLTDDTGERWVEEVSYNNGWYAEDKVIAWMPNEKPEPYQGE